MYYLGNRYYNSAKCRFLNSDCVLGFSPTAYCDILNPFVYATNSPVMCIDTSGFFPDLFWDIASLVGSVIDVIANPSDPWAWAGLAGDVIDVCIPLVGGVGEVAKAAGTVSDVNKAVKRGDAALEAAQSVKPYAKHRPSYAKGQIQAVWDNNYDPILGGCKDPLTGQVIKWDKSKPRGQQWHMGHISGSEYSKMHKRYMAGDISKQEFLDWFHDPSNYYPELPSSNMSHKLEQK